MTNVNIIYYISRLKAVLSVIVDTMVAQLAINEQR